MRNFKSLVQGLSLVMAVIALSACGSKSSKQLADSNSSSQNNGAGATPTPVNGGNINNLAPAPQNRFEITGATGTQPTQSYTLTSETLLKVKIKALAAPNVTIPGYSNWVLPYGCMQVQVTVNGSTQTTALLKVEGIPQGSSSPCANAPTYQVLDFSSVMTGAGPVNISIHHANYDNCRTYNPLYYGCGMSQVWQNHRVAGNVTIQTNDTWMDL